MLKYERRTIEKKAATGPGQAAESRGFGEPMNIVKVEKFLACLLIAVLAAVFNVKNIFAAPATDSASASANDTGTGSSSQPTCAC